MPHHCAKGLHFSAFHFCSAVSPIDYWALNTLLTFAVCEIQRCVNVTIVNDFVEVRDENFFYNLERTSGLHQRIILSPSSGQVVINGIIIIITKTNKSCLIIILRSHWSWL